MVYRSVRWTLVSGNGGDVRTYLAPDANNQTLFEPAYSVQCAESPRLAKTAGFVVCRKSSWEPIMVMIVWAGGETHDGKLIASLPHSLLPVQRNRSFEHTCS